MLSIVFLEDFLSILERFLLVFQRICRGCPLNFQRISHRVSRHCLRNLKIFSLAFQRISRGFSSDLSRIPSRFLDGFANYCLCSKWFLLIFWRASLNDSLQKDLKAIPRSLWFLHPPLSHPAARALWSTPLLSPCWPCMPPGWAATAQQCDLGKGCWSLAGWLAHQPAG